MEYSLYNWENNHKRILRFNETASESDETRKTYAEQV